MTEIEIDRLSAEGLGLGQDDAGARHAVPGLLPGERARLRAAAESGGAPEIDELLRVAPERATPPCPHAAGCGGCALQHAAPDFLASWKRALAVEALERAGLAAPVAATVASPLRSRRRVKLSARRAKKGVRLGFYQRRSHQIEPIDACLIARPEIIAALPSLQALAALGAPRARPVGIWVETTEAGLDVALDQGKALDLELRARAADWAESADVARLSWNGEVLAARRPPWRRYGRALVAPPPGAFAQATAEGEAALTRLATEALGACDRVADLFAGAGAFALALAERSEVLAIEQDQGLLDALAAGWRRASGLKRVVAARRDLFRRPLLPEEMTGLDGALFDPPRAGAQAQAEALAAAPPRMKRLVGVSCNPASFARDAAILARGGWRLAAVTPIDQFLFSPHLELIGVFER